MSNLSTFHGVRSFDNNSETSGVSAVDPGSVTHAIAVDGSALAFLTMCQKRRVHCSEQPLAAGWYALHVKPTAPEDLNVGGIGIDIPSDLPADCIIATIELGPSGSSRDFAGAPFVEHHHCNTILQVVALQHPIAFSFSGPCALDLQMQTEIREALPDQWNGPSMSNKSESCVSQVRKRSRQFVSTEVASPLQQQLLPCCENALADFRHGASKQLAPVHDRYQDALHKAELRTAAMEAELQRCEETLANVKQETSMRVAEVAQDAATRIADAEKLAKKFKAELDTHLKAAQQLREEIEEELRSKYAEELRVTERARAGVLQGVEWQYEFNGRWCTFDATPCEQLLRKYVKYASSNFDKSLSIATVVSGSHTYLIDFEAMRQTNVATSKSRAVRMKCEVPDTWQKPSAALMWQPTLSQIHTQETYAEVWDIAQKLLTETAHTASSLYPSSICETVRNAKIKKIRRVENHLLWRRYQQHVAEMEVAQARAGVKADGVYDVVGILKPEFAGMLKELSGDNFMLNQRVNEQWLMHGTSSDTGDKIIEGGFDPRVSSTAGLYGAGTYFSSQSCKCHQYTAGPERCILLCRVALGIPFYTKTADQSLRRPPPLRRDSQHLHGCIIANEGAVVGHPHGRQAHQEFVIFDGAQAFPQYVISYRV